MEITEFQWHDFLKNFRQINSLMHANANAIHSAHCGNYGNLLSPKKIFRQITYLSISLVEIVTFTRFLPKKNERTMQCGTVFDI